MLQIKARGRPFPLVPIQARKAGTKISFQIDSETQGGSLPRLRWPNRANRFADLCESPILANRPRVPEQNPLFGESRFGALKIANRGFGAIRKNCSNVMKIGVFFLRIDSRELADSRCESQGHLS